MADVSSPDIAAAYEDVRNDKSETNWLLLDYEGDKSDKLNLTATGTGGLDELKTKFADERASFAYARITYSNDKESTRDKFIFITYIGSGVRVMRKAKISVHKSEVQKVLRAFSIEVPAENADDLAEAPIVTRLRKAGGASYDRA
ncbi:BZ3500_MvSof-1268-A1-R1_Chr3-1g05432 [Microbotryum saponariae]|uniref:BZ3500_MvSof-1268-A1-R1_Chr3-1g05432 protein n=1 Tax=Microbotryum saponariae TaxID=289078 RepID=A0A2X0LHU4_9BASI|nr:BZ3500_MvSof-1268-A1-R1_Chr3-1g05432 [Microbotryum saponariae]SDA04623.1 BZ3501_MvSof-1269-A2-R1_Chr3-1g05103 [Microbotryum saponariae]